MGPERLDRARTVESVAAVTVLGRPPWACVVLVRYPPRAVRLAASAAVDLPCAPAGGHSELVFPAVDSVGRSVGAGSGVIAPCVACIGIVQGTRISGGLTPSNRYTTAGFTKLTGISPKSR